MRVVGVLVGVILLLVVMGDEVAASTPWTSAPPVIYKDSPMSSIPDTPCPTYYQEISIANIADTRKACQFVGTDLTMSRFTQDNGKSALAVRYPGSKTVHRLEGVCEGQVRCLYSPEQDMVVTNLPIPFNQQGVEVFRNARQRISATFDPTTLSIRYVFDASHPDYIFRDSHEAILSARSFAVSNNGEWLAIELKDFGTAIVHMTDFSTRRVIAWGPQYGVGLDPTVEMAVNNAGTTVVVAGSNADFLIADITHGCGETLVVEHLAQRPPPHLECPTISGVVPDLTPLKYTVFHPRFDSSGEQLSFIYAPKNRPTRAVILRTVNFHTPEQEYIALGDSFSSGEGETSDRLYRLDSVQPLGKCHVSLRSYPFLLGIPAAQNVACSGAKLADISNLRRDSEQELSALEDFRPGKVPQADFIDYYKPTVATIGIGGNDAGLMIKLRSCAMIGTCDWVQPDMRSRVANEIGMLFEDLVELYTHLDTLSPVTHMFAVGYPRIVEIDGKCDSLTAALLNRDERVFMDESIRYLNQVIASAAAQVGIGFLDIEDSYREKKLCGDSPTLAINGLRLGGDNPFPLLVPMLRIIGSETFHPTPLGHRLAADMILSQHGDLRQYGWCSDDTTTCPADSILPPAPSYWGAAPSASPVLRQSNFATKIADAPGEYLLAVGSKTFRPNEPLTVEMRSPLREVTSLRANDEGGVRSAVTLPQDLPEGFYSLHLVGTGYEGESTELYQEISIPGRPEPEVPIVQELPPQEVLSGEKRDLNKLFLGNEPRISAYGRAKSGLAVLGTVTPMPSPGKEPSDIGVTIGVNDNQFIIFWTASCLFLVAVITVIIFWGAKSWRGT